MKKVVVASVGFTWDRVARAVGRIGVGEGDAVLLFNSVPEVQQAIEAMERLRKWIEETYSSVTVEVHWLDPRNGFEKNVAFVRKRVETYAPCRAWFLAVGGFRWLAIAISYAAFATYTVGEIRRIRVESLELELEEDTRSRNVIRQLFPTQESRVIKVPILVKLADVDYEDLLILETIARGVRRAKQLSRELGIPRATLQRKLMQLVNKGLLTYEKRGRSYLYTPTPLAQMLL